jgi:hypothetical protein
MRRSNLKRESIRAPAEIAPEALSLPAGGARQEAEALTQRPGPLFPVEATPSRRTHADRFCRRISSQNKATSVDIPR